MSNIEKVQQLLEQEAFPPAVQDDDVFVLPIEGEDNYLAEYLREAGAYYEKGVWLVKA